MEKTFKKLLAALLAVTVLTALSGCVINDAVDSIRGQLFEAINFEDDSNYTEVKESTYIDCDYYEPLDSVTYGYDSLTTDEQRGFYDSLYDAAYRISEEFSDEGLYAIGKITVGSEDFSEAEMHLCINAFAMDHPEVFWLSNVFEYGSMGGQTVVQLYSYVSGDQCTALIDQLNTAVQNIITSVPSGLNQYHLEKYIHNTLIDMCEYADGVSSASDGWEYFTSYGALVNGSVVCEGYSYAISLLLRQVGIDCYNVNGYGNDEMHMWNVVNIDGNWYHLDATWNDSENSYFTYFNLTQEQVEADHIIAPLFTELEGNEGSSQIFNVYVPECTVDSANYYVVESTYVYDYDEVTSTMVYDLVNAANNKDTDFTIRFDSSLNFDDAIDVMFNEEPYYMFSYINQANEQLENGCKINDESVSILIIEKFNSVVVKLEYT